jgi:glycosyltransferase involved in cell wall biosynthesis
MSKRLRIAQVAPPMERVPPERYGGTERVVYELIAELVRRGHDVTTFASGDSDVPGRLVPTVPEALRPIGFEDDPSGFFLATLLDVIDRQDEFDVIHGHLEWWTLMLGRSCRPPVAATFHGRIDNAWSRPLIASAAPTRLVGISNSQISAHPEVPWTVVYNGLSLDGAPFERRRADSLCFVGRIALEKGVVEAIDIAIRADMPLKIAAKVATSGPEGDYAENVFQPALRKAGSLVEFLGELSGAERDQLFAESYASLMPGLWPEPFGLSAIESLACGTPVIGRRVGALPEIIRHGTDGFFGDDAAQMAFFLPSVADLDRAAIRESVIDRFSAARMADGYEALYLRMLGEAEEEGQQAATADGSRIVEGSERIVAMADRKVPTGTSKAG